VHSRTETAKKAWGQEELGKVILWLQAVLFRGTPTGLTFLALNPSIPTM
jgi:hypothetical protein